MPLFLHYTLAPGLLLHQVLDEILSNAENFSLTPPVFFLTRNGMDRDDVEAAVLKHPKNPGRWAGNRIQSLYALKQELIFHHPEAREITPLPLQIKVLKKVLEGTEWANGWNAQRGKHILREWDRLVELEALLTHPQNKSTPWKRLRNTWEETIQKSTPYWTPGQWTREAWQVLTSMPWFQDQAIGKLWILGFPLPDPELLQVLPKLLKLNPTLDIHWTLFPPELGIDPNQNLANAYTQLEAWSESQERHAFPSPQLERHAFSTVLHEVESALACSGQSGHPFLALAPQNSESFTKFWQAAQENENPLEGPAQLEWSTSLRWHEWLPAGNETDTIPFEVYFQQALTRFEELRQTMAKERNAAGIRFLGLLENTLRTYRGSMVGLSEEYSPGDWQKKIVSDIPALFSPLKDPLRFSGFLRPLEQTGLKTQERGWIFGLEDQSYPGNSPYFLTVPDFSDPLPLHEKRLLLLQACHHFTKQLTLSSPSLNLAGRTLNPSRFLLSEASDSCETQAQALQIRRRNSHPYFEENARRESDRILNRTLNEDSGKLSEPGIPAAIRSKIQARPISVTSLEDFGLCPWRFFAKWHLRLEDAREEDLEFRPMDRGRFQHEVLELVYRSLAETYFSKRQWPNPDEQAAVVSAVVEPYREAHAGEPPFSNYPPVLTEDFFDRLQEKILEILAEEGRLREKGKRFLWPHYFEWSFGRPGQAEFSLALNSGEKIPLSGQIDRIDVDPEGRTFLVLDYKNSSSGDLARRIREGRSYQLYLYQEAVGHLLLKGHSSLGGLYWDLKTVKRDQGLVPQESFLPYAGAKSRSHSFLSDDKYSLLNNKLKDSVEVNFKRILAGDFALDPADCQGESCPFSAVCRFPDKP